ncbi:MAG: hypothetical protein PVJ39_20655 [Gammaproteobacteria bacterium]|jgi:hypothetical protein
MGMNIWAANKDISIKHLLLMLAERFQEGSYEIVDSPLDDERAVRLANPATPNIQLYVFTYGQEDERYGIHIEYPNLQETNYSDTVETYDNVSFDALVNIMITNLELPVTCRAE